MENILHISRNGKKNGIAILTSDKINKTKTVTKDKEEHYIMIKGSIQEKDNICKYSCT